MTSLDSILAALDTEYRGDATASERQLLSTVRGSAELCFNVARATIPSNIDGSMDAVVFFGLGCLETLATKFWNVGNPRFHNHLLPQIYFPNLSPL